MGVSSLTMRPMNEEMGSGEILEDIVLLSYNTRAKFYRASKGGKFCFLKAPATDSGLNLAMIKREWEFGRKLHHTGIVNMLSYEEASPVGPCIVMDYIEGRTLSTFLAEGASFAERRKVFRQILDAVEYLHRQGVVHNDLKPDNILVRNEDNNATIIDLGLSDDDAHYLTKAMGGTPGYASPELSAGEKVDARSDIWSLGVILKEMFGKRYSRIVEKCLKTDKEKRFSTVERLAATWKWYYKKVFILAAILILSLTYIGFNIPYKRIHRQLVERFHTFTPNPDLSAKGTANCYIIPAEGEYSFEATVKGSTSTPISGTPVAAHCIWESFCTEEPINTGDLIQNVRLENGRVHFYATGRNGNAAVAIFDAEDHILWSWHLWCCKGYDADYFAQEYRNNAGKLMDRNLGATSAVPGKVECMGLFYQWGRKDPFLGSASLATMHYCEVTGEKVFNIELDTLLQTYSNSVANPTLFFCRPASSIFHTDGLEWERDKNENDPCPPGWKVIEGGPNGFWAKALEGIVELKYPEMRDTIRYGINLASLVGVPELEDDCIWFPFAGVLSTATGEPFKMGSDVRIWTSFPNPKRPEISSNRFSVSSQGIINYTTSDVTHATAISVRCCKIRK